MFAVRICAGACAVSARTSRIFSRISSGSQPVAPRQPRPPASETAATSAGDVVDLRDVTPALGRRFRAVKLWAVLRAFGREGLQSAIREHVRLAQLFAAWVEAEPGWEVAAPHPFSVVCFRHEGSDDDNRATIERVNASGLAYLAGTVLDGRFVLRIAIGHERTTEDDVRSTWEALRGARP